MRWVTVIMLGQGGRFAVLSGSDGSVLVAVEAVVGEAGRSDELGIALDGIGDLAGDENPYSHLLATGTLSPKVQARTPARARTGWESRSSG